MDFTPVKNDELKSVVLQLHVQSVYENNENSLPVLKYLKTYLMFSNIHLKPHLSQTTSEDCNSCFGQGQPVPWPWL